MVSSYSPPEGEIDPQSIILSPGEGSLEEYAIYRPAEGRMYFPAPLIPTTYQCWVQDADGNQTQLASTEVVEGLPDTVVRSSDRFVWNPLSNDQQVFCQSTAQGLSSAVCSY